MSKFIPAFKYCFAAFIFITTLGAGAEIEARTSQKSQLAECTVLIIRHAEKPEAGKLLSEEGEARAAKYADYFDPFDDGNEKFKIGCLYATHESKNSNRPVLTITPLSQKTGLPINADFENEDFASLSESLKSSDHPKHILISWHHGKIGNLVKALGGHRKQLLPNGDWPDDVFNWVIELKYDKNGNLANERKIIEDF